MSVYLWWQELNISTDVITHKETSPKSNFANSSYDLSLLAFTVDSWGRGSREIKQLIAKEKKRTLKRRMNKHKRNIFGKREGKLKSPHTKF